MKTKGFAARLGIWNQRVFFKLISISSVRKIEQHLLKFIQSSFPNVLLVASQGWKFLSTFIKIV
jgi:hypothetical protein